MSFGGNGILSGLTERDRANILESLCLRLTVDMDDLAIETRSLKEELSRLKRTKPEAALATSAASVSGRSRNRLGVSRFQRHRNRQREPVAAYQHPNPRRFRHGCDVSRNGVNSSTPTPNDMTTKKSDQEDSPTSVLWSVPSPNPVEDTRLWTTSKVVVASRGSVKARAEAYLARAASSSSYSRPKNAATIFPPSLTVEHRPAEHEQNYVQEQRHVNKSPSVLPSPSPPSAQAVELLDSERANEVAFDQGKNTTDGGLMILTEAALKALDAQNDKLFSNNSAAPQPSAARIEGELVSEKDQHRGKLSNDNNHKQDLACRTPPTLVAQEKEDTPMMVIATPLKERSLNVLKGVDPADTDAERKNNWLRRWSSAKKKRKGAISI